MARPITITNAIISLRPNSLWNLQNTTEYSTLEWLDPVQTKPTEAEINEEIVRLTAAQPTTLCKEEAKRLIAASDWSVLPDVGISNSAEFVAYRTILRELIKTPVDTPSFPTEPQPVWL